MSNAVSTSELADRKLAAAALQKQQAGQRPARDELAALRRVEKARDAALRATHYGTIAKKDWREWSGRQHKVLNDQADRYGLPIRGRTIDLPAVVRWLHDFLAANARKLAGSDDEDPAVAGASSPYMEEKRKWDAKRSKLAFEEATSQKIDRQAVRAAYSAVADVLRRAGEALRKQHGNDAQKILNDALGDADATIDRMLNNVDD